MAAARPDHSEPTSGVTFVGRERELEILGRKLANAFAGRGSIVMLAGEAGIGKTWIAHQFARRARLQGGFVLSGCCFEGDWQPPYGPWVEAIGEYVRRSDPDRLRQEHGPSAPTLARLVPGLRTALPETPLPSPLSPEEERVRLYDAVIQFLLTVARENPILLVLDDLHWADRDSLRLLRYLARMGCLELRIASDGEVQVRGENVTEGYWRDAERTCEAFSDGWYLTGDVGRLDKDGYLYLHGRKRDTIVLASGLNVYPEDVENALKASPEVKDCVVLGLAGATGPRVHAVLLLEDPQAAKEVVRLANVSLASHQHISGFTLWPDPDFPCTHTLKVKRSEVEARVLQTVSR